MLDVEQCAKLCQLTCLTLFASRTCCRVVSTVDQNLCREGGSVLRSDHVVLVNVTDHEVSLLL